MVAWLLEGRGGTGHDTPARKQISSSHCTCIILCRCPLHTAQSYTAARHALSLQHTTCLVLDSASVPPYGMPHVSVTTHTFSGCPHTLSTACPHGSHMYGPSASWHCVRAGRCGCKSCPEAMHTSSSKVYCSLGQAESAFPPSVMLLSAMNSA